MPNRPSNIFGWELVLNLYGCNSDKISDKELLIDFINILCEVLDMKKFGEPIVEHFGHGRQETSGYTIVQLIETSSLVLHLSEINNSAYLNIFSCKEYDKEIVEKFCNDYFQSVDFQSTYLTRN
jgi:S-adenosylmethionine/arginine decarboxylase-like enzyme